MDARETWERLGEAVFTINPREPTGYQVQPRWVDVALDFAPSLGSPVDVEDVLVQRGARVHIHGMPGGPHVTGFIAQRPLTLAELLSGAKPEELALAAIKDDGRCWPNICLKWQAGGPPYISPENKMDMIWGRVMNCQVGRLLLVGGVGVFAFLIVQNYLGERRDVA